MNGFKKNAVSGGEYGKLCGPSLSTGLWQDAINDLAEKQTPRKTQSGLCSWASTNQRQLAAVTVANSFVEMMHFAGGPNFCRSYHPLRIDLNPFR